MPALQLPDGPQTHPWLQRLRDFGPWSPGRQFMRRIKEIDDLIYAEISDRRAQPDSSRTDILSLMMAAHLYPQGKRPENQRILQTSSS